MSTDFDFVVVGGGAAGFFGAISYAEARPGSRVTILEKSGSVLGKVKISGGGRCNVTHSCFDAGALTAHYPRGEKSLIGAFHRWGASDTVEWFESRGVKLKTEADGRMFPVTDSSGTIMDCLQEAAASSGVELRLRTGVEGVKRNGEVIILQLADGSTISTGALLLATGGVRNGSGQRLAGELGHEVIPAAPSLFTFNIQDPRLEELAGLSVNSVSARVIGTKLKSTGPCLVTHWGLSGPAILRLSAWGARELCAMEYRFEVEINWMNGKTAEEVNAWLQSQREVSPRKQVETGAPDGVIPSRLWKRLVAAAGIENTSWSNLSRDSRRKLAGQLVASTFTVDGKSMNKEEFVTAGGVNLKEVNFKTMESRLIPGLYFAGEVLDIDGITGGFNFQAAWTTSKIAGESAAWR